LFRGIAYYGAGTLVVNQDKPSDPQYVITAANVIDGIFNYSGTSQKHAPAPQLLDTRPTKA
jgi:predicted phage tail protein